MFALALLLFASAPEPDCRYDREALIALDAHSFDQDLTGGWRALQERGCIAQAADLIRDYREAEPQTDPGLLAWHEGQLRAILGQNDAAIMLFGAARKPASQDIIGWNHYVDGSIAFLRHDRAALQRARETLAALPRPAELPLIKMNGQSVPMSWPLNLNVLDGFLKCFDRPYQQAYATPACTVSMKFTVPNKKPVN